MDYVNDPFLFGMGASACRMLEGIGNACINTAIYALITSHYKNNEADIISFLQIFTGVGMMTGPLLGSFLYSIGGYQLPFLVTGAILFVILIVSWVSLPSTPVKIELTLTPKLAARHVMNPLTYTQALQEIKVLLIGPTVTLTLMHLTMKEPVLQIRLADFGIDPKFVGLFFTLDVIGYIFMTMVLGRYK
jgi:MFS family permease